MLPIRKFYLLSVFISFSSLSVSAQSSNNDTLALWQTTYLNKMTPGALQLTANYLYLSYAIALIELKIRQFSTPISRLNQAIRTNVAEYKDASEDLTMLKTLLDRLSYVTGARTIYIETLNTCVKHHNDSKGGHFMDNINSRFVDEALQSIQLDAQNKIRAWADEKAASTAEHLKLSSSYIAESAQYFHSVSGLHKGMSEGAMPIEITEENELNKAIIMFDIILNSNPTLLTMAENVINMLNETSDHAAQVIAVGAEIYKQYYTTIHTIITSPTFNKQYATTQFGMHDLLPEEYKSQLPDADHVFEHMLQTTKLYTQTELLHQ